MGSIHSESVLSVFNLVRDAILASDVLSKKFETKMIVQFEPKHKSRGFSGFPYFWVNIPEATPEKLVFDNSLVNEELSCTVILRMDWEARDNYLSYANAFLKAIADYESTFESAGYYDVMPRLIDTNPNQTIEEKQVVEGEFSLDWHGHVRRD